MKFLSTAICAAVLGAFALVAAPAAQAQVNININTAPPAWGPPVPAGTQFYYIPEIDGYYDLYAQQYIVYRNGQWIPVAVINGYDPRAFHPVVLDYRGREPWGYVRSHRDRHPRTIIVRQNRALPPGQAKKLYRQGYQEGRRDDRGHGNGNGQGREHGRN
ncbi:MAG: hypothetical protein JWR44_542 [Hymenobacter sp.]|jgi:hypothetical protein|nr:hypothetical protein [Hymenobacter sp.]